MKRVGFGGNLGEFFLSRHLMLNVSIRYSTKIYESKDIRNLCLKTSGLDV